jgi:small conductance mechanosensitive channel
MDGPRRSSNVGETLFQGAGFDARSRPEFWAAAETVVLTLPVLPISRRTPMQKLQIRSSFFLFLASIAIVSLCFGSAPAIADSHSPDAEASSGTEDAVADAAAKLAAAQEEFASLLGRRLSDLAEAARLDADATHATGQDRAALQLRAFELRLAGVDTLKGMSGQIEAIEGLEQDASAQREGLAALLPTLDSDLRSDFAKGSADLATLKASLSDLSDAGDIAWAESAIVHKGDSLQRILEAEVDTLELAVAVDAPIEGQRGWIDEQVLTRARLAASYLALGAQALEAVADRKAAGAEVATLESMEAAAKLRMTTAVQNLEAILELMQRLELDDAQYRQLLLTSTGTLTVDAIDREIARELFGQWATEIREGAVTNGPGYLFQFILFAVIVSLFVGVSRLVRKIVTRAVEAPHLRFSELLKRMLVSLSTGAVLVLGLLVALSQLGIEVAPMLAGLGIAGFVLGFALQDTLGNFAAGVMILMYRPYDVEDMIDCAGGVFGKVSHMSLVSTTILTIDNKTLIVPNSKIWGDVITNVTAQSIRRIDLEFGIGYGDDIPHAEEVLWSVIKDHDRVLEHPEPVIKVHSLGDSSVNFVVRPWVARDDYWDVHWDITREVKLRFDREGVSIPFPQRDVHFYPTESPAESGAATTDAAPAMAEAKSPLSSTDRPDPDPDADSN